MKKNVLKLIATMVVGIAVFAVSTASFLWGNQPEVPAEMLE
jgi:cyclic lactone autoinducer peptide